MIRIDPTALETFATEVLSSIGIPKDTAATVATSLVAADLRGHTSHGTLRLNYYRRLVEDGIINPTASPELVEENGPTARIDGHHAFGQVVGREISAQLIARADDHGVACVGGKDATHLGRIGEWGERVAAEGFAVLGFVNTQGGGQRVAPAGSAVRRLSTNPIVIAVPTFGALPYDIVLDMATSQVAHGKLRERRHTQDAIPDGWAVDSAGNSVNDVTAFYEQDAALRPLGGAVSGYKGFGLATVAELLAGCLAGGTVAGMTNPDYSNNAAGFLAVDLGRFLSKQAVRLRVTALRDHIEGTETQGVSAGAGADDDVPQLPGAPEYEKLQRNREQGVPLDEHIAASLAELGAEIGVAPPPGLSGHQ